MKSFSKERIIKKFNFHGIFLSCFDKKHVEIVNDDRAATFALLAFSLPTFSSKLSIFYNQKTLEYREIETT